jgi:RNA polymerase sigma factor (sigma-70 family)
MSDWQLVAAYVRGDEQAFANLVRQYFPTVYSAAVRQVGDPHLAEEIAQSVFILFSRKAARLSPKVLLTGWFLRTTQFVARDALKQMKRRFKHEREAADAALISREGDAAWATLAPLLDEALLALPDREQACVMARFIEGRSFSEIAAQQGITDDTAQKRVSRSLEKMRAFLERRGLKVGTTSIVGLLGADLAGAAQPRLIESTLHTLQAAAQGQGSGGLVLADHAARALAWRSAAKAGLSIVTGLVLLLVGFLLWQQNRPAAPAFQVSDPSIDTLGRAWAVMAQRVAFLTTFAQGRPPAGDPNRVAFDQANAFVQSETLRITTELSRFMESREQVAEFLTVELRENLGLTPRQQAEVFAQLRAQLSQGATAEEGMRTLWNSKKNFATSLRASLSPEQKQRFDQTYRADGLGLLAFVGIQLGKM